MITGPQLRAARALIDWTREEVAKAAEISPETVKNIEKGIFRPQEETIQKIIKTFAQQDVVFTENEGVQLKKDAVTRFQGADGFKRFMDDVYKAACEPSAIANNENYKPICVSSVDDRLFVKHLGEYMNVHAARMDKLGKVKVRALVREQDFFTIPGGYPEYRWCPNQTQGAVPFYVYGDKFAILILEEKAENIQIIVITSSIVAKVYRDQFDMLWKMSKAPEKPKIR